MKKNLLASLALAFATAFALADGNLGTPTKVGSLSRSNDYVYKCGEVDSLLGARVPAARTVNGHSLSNNVTITAADIGVEAGANNYTHPTYTARTGKPAANQAPGFGGTFTVSQITSDSSGHVIGATDRTITIPSTNATTTTAGLMSAADKTALDSLSSGAVTKSAITAALQAKGLSAANDTAASLDDMDTIAAKVAAIIAVLDALD